MNTAIIITIIICVTILLSFTGLLIFAYKSGQKEREIRKIFAMKEAPKTFIDYLMGGNKNAESNHDND